MQRQNSILKSSQLRYKTKRGGFAIIMAIAVIVVLATIMALSLSLTSQTAKRTTDIYLHEQVVLLAKSAVEFSLFQIAANGPCYNDANTLNFKHNNIYDINITNRFIYTFKDPANTVLECLAGTTAASLTYNANPDSNGTVIIDVAISVDDTTITSEPIRYFRRTIQKL